MTPPTSYYQKFRVIASQASRTFDTTSRAEADFWAGLDREGYCVIDLYDWTHYIPAYYWK